ncbi:hypothetical protein H5410_050005 [Solanum commersonii]|uniref:Uncharacterized protein n=1 Tax=Solanum commersonii TaxID=4109 RepID=A0A9J5WUD8_SOLCO|nr:hypothetical protein H5410_050005 [Solanum commersonii]
MAATATERPSFERTYYHVFNEEKARLYDRRGITSSSDFKLSHGTPNLKVLRSILLKHFGTKGNCLIDLLAPRQILLRFDLYEDYVLALSHSVNYLLYNGEDHQCRVFPWSIGYNPKEETTLASLLSIASTVGKPIAIDKATQIKSRPSTARVKVILNLMEKLPNRIRLQFVDGKSGKLIEVSQEIVYDNLPLYCNYCKHQGHDEDSFRLISKGNQNNKQIDDTIEGALKGTTDSEKYQGDTREILNEKRKTVDVDQSKDTPLDQQLVSSTFEQNRVNSMDVDTSNIGVQTTTENKGGTLRIGVDAPRVDSGKKLMDSGQKIMDTSDVEDAENSGQHVLQGPTGNFHDSEKRQDTKKQVSPPALNSKLSPEALVFVPKCVLARKNESSALVSNTIDLGEDSLNEDEEDNMLDICFDRVAREGDISPRQQRSGSNKSKNKIYGRQHSWDGKMTEEFVPRHLPMRQAKQNHLSISRFN